MCDCRSVGPKIVGDSQKWSDSNNNEITLQNCVTNAYVANIACLFLPK